MKQYQSIDPIIHQLSQIIAKVNRTFVLEKNDDSHTNLLFDPIRSRIYGRWFEAEKGRIVLALNLKESTFEWIDDFYNVLSSTSIVGQTQSKLEDILIDKLSLISNKKTSFSAPLHFEIPEYSFLNQPYQAFDEVKINEWVHYRSIANGACHQFADLFLSDEKARIWPHHFDTGVYFQATPQIGLGFGLAMQDDLVGEAYFYLAGYPLKNNTISYIQTNKLSFGHWKKGEWKGAVLRISEASEETLPIFLKEASQWFID